MKSRIQKARASFVKSTEHFKYSSKLAGLNNWGNYNHRTEYKCFTKKKK